jgi:uncharacterized integral membrane protein
MIILKAALTGALIGAVILGAWLYITSRLYPAAGDFFTHEGVEWQWGLIGAYVGAIGGFILGLIIGLAIMLGSVDI